MSSSTTAVAAITPHNAGSLSSLVANSVKLEDHSSEKHFGLVDKLHGFTEKLHHLSHLRLDSEASKTRTGSFCPFLSFPQKG